MIEATLTAGLCDHVHVLALPAAGLPPAESRRGGTVTVERRALRISRNVPGALRHPFQYASWVASVLLAAFRRRPIAVQATSVETLPAAVILGIFRRIPVVYDAAELESEKFPGRPRASRIVRAIERVCLPFVAETCVVSGSIADWYVKRYGVRRPPLVRNLPARAAQASARTGALRRRLGIPDDALVALFQGGLAPGRGIPALVDAALRLPADRHVVFLGYGPLEPLVEAAAREKKNVHFWPAVPPAELPALTADADLGLILYEDVCLNHRYCLPNKLFEFYLAGLPVLASDLVEMRRFIEAHDAGVLVTPTAEGIHRYLSSVDLSELRKRRARGVPANAPSWEEEKDVYLGMLSRALVTKSRGATFGTSTGAPPREAR